MEPLPRMAILALAVATLVGLSAQPAAQRQGLTKADERAIEEMFVSYNRALIEKDYVALREHLESSFIVIDATTQVVSDLDAVIEGFRRRREAMDPQGYATSTPGAAHFLVLTEDRVLMDRAVRHYKRDGTLLQEQANVYIVSRSSGRWRIAGVMRQDPSQVGKFD
jgi:hypothetical protein